MSEVVARIGRPRRLAVDVSAAVNLVGTLGKYLGLTALFPIAVALWYGEPFWPFLVAGVVTSGFGLALERLTAGAAERIGVREGFLVVSATWLLAAGFASLPYLLGGGPQLDHPVDAYFEGMSGFTTTGATVVTDYDTLSRSIDMWRAFTQWLGGMGIVVLAVAVLPRLRIGGRQLMESELPGPEIAQLSGADPQDRPATVGALRRADGRGAARARVAWLARDRRSHDLLRGAVARVHDDADRRVLDAGTEHRGVLGGGAVDHRRLHAHRRSELRAHVPRSRTTSPAGDAPRRGVPALRRDRGRRLRRRSRR